MTTPPARDATPSALHQSESLQQIVQRLRHGAGPNLDQRSIQEWRQLWQQACPEYLAAIENNLEPIATTVAMHPATVLNSVKVLLSGLTASSLQTRNLDDSNSTTTVTLVVLAASVPGLAAQSLLPLLASGSAVLLKPSSREPHTARLLVEVLCRIDPALTTALAIFDEAGFSTDSINQAGLDRVIVYGEDATVSQFNKQFAKQSQSKSERAVAVSSQGHGWSLVYLGESPADEAIFDSIALDIARFDQRGCLCPHAVLTSGPAEPIVNSLGQALARVAAELPPSPTATTLGALRQVRDVTVAAGYSVSEQPLATGLVVAAAPDQAVEESPGGRCVRVYGGVAVNQLIERLRPAADQIQSLAVAGPEVASEAQTTTNQLGITLLTEPGAMHSPDFHWVSEQLGLSTRHKR